MVVIEGWAREWAVAEVFGIEAYARNDDRIGRALDALALEQEQIAGTAASQAIARRGPDVSRLHSDMTTSSLYGACEEREAGCACWTARRPSRSSTWPSVTWASRSSSEAPIESWRARSPWLASAPRTPSCACAACSCGRALGLRRLRPIELRSWSGHVATWNAWSAAWAAITT